MALTEKIIRDARRGPTNRIEWDTKVVGLGMRITAGGVKSFVLSYRFGGRKRLMTLARVSELTLDGARESAGAKLVGVREGIDPLAVRDARKGHVRQGGVICWVA